MRYFYAILLLLVGVAGARAEVRTETVHYRAGNTDLKGYLAYDDGVEGTRPGVLVVHEWWGLNDHARDKAEALAQEGFIALAVDMYGGGKTTDHPGTAGEWSGFFQKNPDVGVARFQAALEVLKKRSRTDTDRIAAIGYCFGGGTVLTMAQRGVDLKGVVSFHGALVRVPVEPGAIRAAILVCHGAADPLVPQDDVNAFQKHLAEAGADWQFIAYGDAKHAFTNPEADNRNLPPLGYNRVADERSWRHMLQFFDEIFSE